MARCAEGDLALHDEEAGCSACHPDALIRGVRRGEVRQDGNSGSPIDLQNVLVESAGEAGRSYIWPGPPMYLLVKS